ncbi:MAG: carboxypeptidase-like regulatory domain-containing protein [Nitrososphaeria archaeon]|jgi:hypothetical protein
MKNAAPGLPAPPQEPRGALFVYTAMPLTLMAGGRRIAMTTDGFGRFQFDCLEPGKYTLRVDYAGHRALTTDVDARESTYMGYSFTEK